MIFDPLNHINLVRENGGRETSQWTRMNDVMKRIVNEKKKRSNFITSIIKSVPLVISLMLLLCESDRIQFKRLHLFRVPFE